MASIEANRWIDWSLCCLCSKGCVVLTPVDEAYALRPSLEHLAKEPEAKPQLQSMDSVMEDDKGTELQPLTVSLSLSSLGP